MTGTKKITIKDVALASEVSIATVSRVLNEDPKVNAQIKQKVLETVEQLGYIPNVSARGLKLHTSGTIGFITSDISNGYHVAMARAMEDVIKKEEYNLIVCSTENKKEDELNYLRLLLSKNVDALVINTSGFNDDYILKLNKQIPMVLLNRRLNTPGFQGDFVDCNNELGMFLLAKELIDLGHRDIFIIEGGRNLSNSKERFEGFYKAMLQVGIDVKQDYPFRYEGDYSLESGYHAMEYMLLMEKRPTAIISCNNMMTIGALLALKANRINVPVDISIAGFNGIEHIELMTVRPLIADFDAYAIGQAAGKAILERIKEKSIENREFIFSPKLIPGNALGAPSKNLNLL